MGDSATLGQPQGRKRIRPWNHKDENEKWPDGSAPAVQSAQKINDGRATRSSVEGEKCAEALIALGTRPRHGRRFKRRQDRLVAARGRDVIRWADNDAAGAKWLETTRAGLEAAGVKSIRDVAIPAGKPKAGTARTPQTMRSRALIVGRTSPRQ